MAITIHLFCRLRRRELSKGISSRQRHMLMQLDRLNSPDPVAWRNIDYGPVRGDLRDQADRESRDQAQQRALRSLERRGLIRQEQLCYAYVDNEWVEIPPDYTGLPRFMLGVELTDEGRRVARQLRQRRR
jgi:hypothetical protein